MIFHFGSALRFRHRILFSSFGSGISVLFRSASDFCPRSSQLQVWGIGSVSALFRFSVGLSFSVFGLLSVLFLLSVRPLSPVFRLLPSIFSLLSLIFCPDTETYRRMGPEKRKSPEHIAGREGLCKGEVIPKYEEEMAHYRSKGNCGEANAPCGTGNEIPRNPIPRGTKTEIAFVSQYGNPWCR